MLNALNLDKVFPIYKTDVEYEISQDDLWKKKYNEHNQFLFVSQLENNMYRINISGEMVASQDLSACIEFTPLESVNIFVLDLSSLELVDSSGVAILKKLLLKIGGNNKLCLAFGANQLIRDALVVLLDASGFLTFYDDEKSALNEIMRLAGK